MIVDDLYLFHLVCMCRSPTHDSQNPPTAPRPPATLDADYEVCCFVFNVLLPGY